MTWRSLRSGDEDPKPVSASLDRLTRQLGGAAAAGLTVVWARWERAVGPDVAAHARPVGLRDGVLTVAVDHPAWATQLRFLGAQLLERLGEAAPDAGVSELLIQVRPGASEQAGRHRSSPPTW